MNSPVYRKSSRSNGNGGSNCVQVAFLDTGQVAVRHSKDTQRAPLLFTAAEWNAFIDGAKHGEFDAATG